MPFLSRSSPRVAGLLAAAVGMIVCLLLLKPSYVASAYVVIPPGRHEEGTIRSDAVLVTAATRWKGSKLSSKQRADASAEALRRGMEVASEAGETRISFRSPDPALAVYLANEITSTFLEVTADIPPSLFEDYPPFRRREGPLPKPSHPSKQIRLLRPATTARYDSGRVLILASLIVTFVVADFLLWMSASKSE